MAYSFSVIEQYRSGATFMDKILKGANSRLPVEQPTHFELVLNLKTAKAECRPDGLTRCDWKSDEQL